MENTPRQLVGVAANITRALTNKNNQLAYQRIKKMREEKLSFQKIADTLNEEGLKTSRNKHFTKGSVKQLYDRFANYDALLANKEEIELWSATSPNNSIGVLRRDENHFFHLETRYSDFQHIDFIPFSSKTSKDVEANAFEKVNRVVSFAKKKIIVCNYLFLNLKQEIINRSILEEYFKNIEEVYAKREELVYKRILQLPDESVICKDVSSLIKSISDNEIPKNVKYVLGNAILAIFLLPIETRKHILKILLLKEKETLAKRNKFLLYILPVKRTHNTHMTIDDLSYVREDYVARENGITVPNDITVMRAKGYPLKNNTTNKTIKLHIKTAIDDIEKVTSKAYTATDYTTNTDINGFALDGKAFKAIKWLVENYSSQNPKDNKAAIAGLLKNFYKTATEAKQDYFSNFVEAVMGIATNRRKEVQLQQQYASAIP